MSEICVVIISPDDIGTTQVYLEVIPINNTNGVGNEASKFATFHLKYILSQMPHYSVTCIQ